MGKFSDAFNAIGMAAKKYSPEILTGVGIVGMISTTVLAVRATPKALILIENKKREIKIETIKEGRNESTDISLTKLEIVKTAWKPYVPAFVTGVCSTACLVGASSINARRNAALLAAYTLSETAFADYKDKVIETIGEKKAQEVKDAVARDQVEKNPPSKNTVITTDKGETLCYDSISGRYFKSDIECIRRAINNLNERLLFDTHVALNEFYDEIGLEEIYPMGEQLGWTVDPDSANKGLIELDFSSQLAEGTPCLVVGFRNAPRYDYEM